MRPTVSAQCSAIIGSTFTLPTRRQKPRGDRSVSPASTAAWIRANAS